MVLDRLGLPALTRGVRCADDTRVHLLGVAEHGGHLLDHLEVGVFAGETGHGRAETAP